jgi:uncharacterized protein
MLEHGHRLAQLGVGDRNGQDPRTQEMQPRVNVITLGVGNLERSLAFYRDGLGLQSAGIIGTEFVGDERTPGGAAAMFELDNGVTLALYGREDLAKDAKTALDPATGPFSLGHLVSSRAEVDAVLAPRPRPPAQP